VSTVLDKLARSAGQSAPRPDGVPKVRGQFAFSSDMFAEGMLWGHMLRSPHPAAAIRSIDVSQALLIPGVRAVITSDDVPGRKTYGLDYPDHRSSRGMSCGSWENRWLPWPPSHPDTARRAAAAIVVDYAPTEPMTDPAAAVDAAPIHPLGNVLHRQWVRCGDPEAVGAVWSKGRYETAMQDQAQMGPESGPRDPG